MSRVAADSWRRLLDRFGRIDRERLATAVFLVGAAVTAVTVLLAGFLPAGSALVGLLYPLAVSLPVLGIVLAAVALWWAWTDARSTGSPLLEGEPPEAGSTPAEYRIGADTDRLLGEGAAEWYRCSSDDSSEELSERLAEGAVRTLASRRGLERGAAREAVQSGTWTDDPVAAAFLAADRRQPPDERLRAAVDPGAAYGRRVRRTLGAIEAIDGRSRRALADDADSSARDGRTSTRGDRVATAEPEVEG